MNVSLVESHRDDTSIAQLEPMLLQQQRELRDGIHLLVMFLLILDVPDHAR